MILEALYQLMLRASGITQWVDDRIYSNIKDDDKIGPYIVNSLVSGSRPLNSDLTSGVKTARVQVDCFAQETTDVTVDDIAESVIEFLHGKSFVYKSVIIQLIEFESETSDFDVDDDHSQYTLDFTVNYV